MKKEVLALLLIFAIAGFGLRIYGLGEQSFWIDEVYSSLAAKSILENGAPVMPSGQWYSRAILHTSIVAVSMLVLGVSEFAARLPSVFFGVLCIPLTYFFTRELFDKRVALLASFFIAFSTVEIAFSRQARMYQQLQFFYLLSLFSFARFNKDASRKNLGLLVVSTLFSVFSHALGFVLLVIYPLHFVLKHLREAKKIKNIQLKGSSVNYLLLFVFVLVSGLLGQWRYNAIARILGTQVNYLNEYLGYLTNYFPVMLYLAPLGALIALRNKKDVLLPVMAIILPFYFVVFHQILIGFRYTFLFLPLVFVLASLALIEFSDIVMSFLKTKKDFLEQAKVLVPLLITISVLATTPLLTTNLESEYYLEPSAPQPDFKNVYSGLRKMVNEGDLLIVSYPEVALWYGFKPDYWMAFSISGFPVENALDEQGNYKRTVTPAIRTSEELEFVYENSSRGFIVLDSMAGKRIGGRWEFIRNNTQWLSNISKPGDAGGINAYFWKH